MWDDPIVDEVRKARQLHARKFKYDLKAIVADLKKQQEASGKQFVILPPREPTIFPKTKMVRKH